VAADLGRRDASLTERERLVAARERAFDERQEAQQGVLGAASLRHDR
jgi:hypothetical protein